MSQYNLDNLCAEVIMSVDRDCDYCCVILHNQGPSDIYDEA